MFKRASVAAFTLTAAHRHPHDAVPSITDTALQWLQAGFDAIK